MATNLNNVLVTCASYGSPGLPTVGLLLELRAAGATCLLMKGYADVTLTRCVLAGTTKERLEADPSLRWVFMLDDDVSASAESVGMLMSIAEQVADESGPPSVSGLYLNRHRKPACAAAHLLRGAKPIPFGNEGAVLMPALCGLGAFLTPRESFLAHCSESVLLTWPRAGQYVPLVCESSAQQADELRAFIELGPTADYLWQGEDFDYCAREIEAGRQVIVAPVMFLHESEALLNPADGCVFPGFVP